MTMSPGVLGGCSGVAIVNFPFGSTTVICAAATSLHCVLCRTENKCETHRFFRVARSGKPFDVEVFAPLRRRDFDRLWLQYRGHVARVTRCCREEHEFHMKEQQRATKRLTHTWSSILHPDGFYLNEEIESHPNTKDLVHKLIEKSLVKRHMPSIPFPQLLKSNTKTYRYAHKNNPRVYSRDRRPRTWDNQWTNSRFRSRPSAMRQTVKVTTIPTNEFPLVQYKRKSHLQPPTLSP